MNFLYDVVGRYELQALLAKYDITGICSPHRFRFFQLAISVFYAFLFVCSLLYVACFFLSLFFFFFSFYCVCFVICCCHGEIKFIIIIIITVMYCVCGACRCCV